jgi:hypothetical protein
LEEGVKKEKLSFLTAESDGGGVSSARKNLPLLRGGEQHEVGFVSTVKIFFCQLRSDGPSSLTLHRCLVSSCLALAQVRSIMVAQRKFQGAL